MILRNTGIATAMALCPVASLLLQHQRLLDQSSALMAPAPPWSLVRDLRSEAAAVNMDTAVPQVITAELDAIPPPAPVVPTRYRLLNLVLLHPSLARARASLGL